MTTKPLTDIQDYAFRNTNKMNKQEQGKELLKEFEAMKEMSELRALSNLSLEKPLTEEQYKKMMELKQKILGI